MTQYTQESLGVFSMPLYEASTCESIIDSARGLDGWASAQVRRAASDGGYTSVTQPDIRSASVLTSIHGARICEGFDEKINSIIKPLIEEIWRVQLTEHSGTQLLRYTIGGHYLAHQDAGHDCQNRYFTVICYLNDCFEGGNTWFPSLNYSAIPECGRAILFPARYTHRAQPVIRGEKYILISWILGPAPIAWI